MPTKIQDLLPIQRSVPSQPKPAESRSGERKEEFRQMLDDAANKPATSKERAAESTKSNRKDQPARAGTKSPGKAKTAREGNEASVEVSDEAAVSGTAQADEPAQTVAAEAEAAHESGD